MTDFFCLGLWLLVLVRVHSKYNSSLPQLTNALNGQDTAGKNVFLFWQ